MQISYSVLFQRAKHGFSANMSKIKQNFAENTQLVASFHETYKQYCNRRIEPRQNSFLSIQTKVTKEQEQDQTDTYLWRHKTEKCKECAESTSLRLFHDQTSTEIPVPRANLQYVKQIKSNCPSVLYQPTSIRNTSMTIYKKDHEPIKRQ